MLPTRCEYAVHIGAPPTTAIPTLTVAQVMDPPSNDGLCYERRVKAELKGSKAPNSNECSMVELGAIVGYHRIANVLSPTQVTLSTLAHTMYTHMCV